VLLSKRLAVLRATATNHDGRTSNIGTPSRFAQVAMHREALAVYRELKA
jgi:acyl transferase domain-containing protein